MNAKHNLGELHDALRSDHCGGTIEITTSQDGEVRTATVNGRTMVIPERLTDGDLSEMLASHPGDVSINGIPVERSEPTNQPYVGQWGGHSFALGTRWIGGAKRGGKITLHGVTYRLERGTHLHDAVDGTEFLARETKINAEREEPHYRKVQMHVVRHNITADPDEIHAELYWSRGAARCRPEQTLTDLIRPAWQASRQQAMAVAQTTPENGRFLPGDEQNPPQPEYSLWTPTGRYRPIAATGRTRAAIPSEKMPVGIAYTVARALGIEDNDGWVAVSKSRGHHATLPTIECREIVILRRNGAIGRIGREEMEDEDWTGAPIPQREERATSIRLALTIGYEGDEDAAVRIVVETDLLAAGRYWDEIVWLGQDYREDEELLTESLFEAYWHDPRNPLRDIEREADEYFTHCSTRAVRLSHGELPGFRAEMQRMGNTFVPQSRTPGVAMRHRSGDRHIVAWQPTRDTEGNTSAAMSAAEGVVFGEIVQEMYPHATPGELARIYETCMRSYADRPELRRELELIAARAGAEHTTPWEDARATESEENERGAAQFYDKALQSE